MIYIMYLCSILFWYSHSSIESKAQIQVTRWIAGLSHLVILHMDTLCC